MAINITNLLNDSMIRQRSDIWNNRNEFILGPIKAVQGRYYLVAFALHAVMDRLPRLYSVSGGDGLDLTLINSEIILDNDPSLPPYTAKKALGVFLYGGYCTSSNPNWSAIVNFGANAFSSFAYSIEEASGLLRSPVVQSISVPTNSGTLGSITTGSMAYLTCVSMVPQESYPIVLESNWTMLADAFAENVVPNLVTGFSIPGDNAVTWTEGFYIDQALIACELKIFATTWDNITRWDIDSIWDEPALWDGASSSWDNGASPWDSLAVSPWDNNTAVWDHTPTVQVETVWDI